MRVTFCAYDKPDNVGGPVTWLHRLLPALRAHGIEPTCLFLLHWGETGPALEALRAEGVECRTVLAHERVQDRIRWILKQLRDDPPDVFVPNLVVAAYHAGRWVRPVGIPTVGILHSDDPFYRAIQDEFVFGREAFRVSALVCVSRELEQQVVARPPGHTLVRRISYGVPFPERAVEPAPGRLRLAYVGRLAEEQKRISELTRAVCRAAREVEGVEVVLYGDGPDRTAVEHLLETEGQGLPVRLDGRLSADALQERLREVDALVLLSDYEGLPIALLEAMAHGAVPICLQIRSGIPEIVTHGENGLLVDDREDGFVAAVRRLREEPGLWERLSAAARSSIDASLSTAACAASWAHLLKELHTGAGSKHPISIPRRISLPPVNPALQSADVRHVGPSLLVRLYRRARIRAGRLRRRLLGQPLP